ncbi:MAG: peptidoglycan DD-metalloendopeptidase family protein [Proteobacteria bacterium]|nr:peptidoglycan DD-metalloendopeptidase family protein [Pseudomonadota bacterium]
MSIIGCTSTYAPVEQRNGTSSKKTKKSVGVVPAYYVVKKGDTLFSIAWSYGFDYKTIAKNNKISAPYRIYAGQKLAFKPVTKKKVQYKTKKSPSITKKPVYKKSTKKKATNKQVSKKFTYKNASAIKRKTGATKIIDSRMTKRPKSSGRLKWFWPVRGKVIQKYSPSKGKKGIDISAAPNANIKSSEAGKVVYSGQGLVGYGRMIIIKHNETFLSAYAHNQSILVTEGQYVKKGQTIARLGRSGTDKFKLHFEIRKNGKPVNPLTYLPR